MKEKLLSLLNKFKDKYQPQVDALSLRMQPLREYWKRLSEREQQILALGGVFLVLMFLFSIISMGLDFKDGLKQKSMQLERYQIDAQIFAKQYKNVSQINPNDFSSVNTERVKNDAIGILEVKNPDVILADNTLTIKVDNTKFESVVAFLDQLRKSYGLFPAKLKITRLAQSGYVSFSATFTSVEQ